MEVSRLLMTHFQSSFKAPTIIAVESGLTSYPAIALSIPLMENLKDK